MIRAILHYGPDLPTRIARDLPQEDIDREVINNWTQEAFRLLPRRYELILQRLFDEQLISKKELDKCILSSSTAILQGGQASFVDEDGKITNIENAPFPWSENLDILAQASEPLQEKIRLLEEDCQKLRGSEKGFSLILRSSL